MKESIDEINELGFIEHPCLNKRIVILTKDQKDWLILQIKQLEIVCTEKDLQLAQKDKEIKRLNEEKEFLLRNYSISKIIPVARTEEEARNMILESMQQAQKDKEIKRLNEEKGWLLSRYVEDSYKYIYYPHMEMEEIRSNVKIQMQHELKEKK